MSAGKGKINLRNYINDLWRGGGKRNYLLLALLFLGIILMFAGSFFAPGKKLPAVDAGRTEQAGQTAVSGEHSAEVLSAQLRSVLKNIEGISEVQVFINFANTGESFYARVNEESNRQTTEQDREGGTREISETNSKEDYVLLREAGGGEKPLLLSENTPRASGILVVAGGVENSRLRLQVVRAIQSVLNLPVHRIAVLPLHESKKR